MSKIATTSKIARCDRCSKRGLLHEYGYNFRQDSLFPIYLCKNCAKEWTIIFYDLPEGSYNERKALWIEAFKEFMQVNLGRIC